MANTERDERAGESKESEQVQAQQDPNAQQPGVTLANQDWESYRAETPAAQHEGAPTANEPSTIKADPSVAE